MSAPGRRCLRFSVAHAMPLRSHSLEVTSRKPDRQAVSGARAWGGFMLRPAACDRLRAIRQEGCSSAFWRSFRED